jgi:uracil-DNA glycosylase
MTQASLLPPDAWAPDVLQAWDPQHWPVAPDWRPVIDAFLASPQGQRLGDFLRARLAAGATVFPPQPFRALELTPLSAVRIVILGQDPYHGRGQAQGLAFSVAPGVRLPPSLRNIFKELGVAPAHGSLIEWAQRGVLLLNTCLTVEEGHAASHARQGWEALTDALLARVAATASPCVYFLWGAHAHAKASLIRAEAAAHDRDVLVIESNHPSPLSASRGPVPFLGSGQFGQARRWLFERGQSDIL